MARVKSLITGTAVDQAKKSHNCQANSRHRINMGDVRLNVRNGRSWDRYCVACAEEILRRDVQKLEGIQQSLANGG